MDIPFIAALIIDQWFSVFSDPLGRFIEQDILHTEMSDILSAVVIRFHTVMITEQMTVRVFFFDDLLESRPVLCCLRETDIIFICHAPPDRGQSGQSSDRIPEIDFILLCSHRRKSPSVVGMEQDQIRFDAHISKLKDRFFQSLPEPVIRTIYIPFAVSVLLKCKTRRFILVKLIGFWENTVAYLIKRGILQRLHRLPDKRVLLMDQRIDRCSKRDITCSVLIDEMCFLRAHQSVSFSRNTFFGSFCLDGAAYLPGICPAFLRNETHFIDSVSVIKSFYFLILSVTCENSVHLRKGFRTFRKPSVQHQFKYFILLHFFPPFHNDLPASSAISSQRPPDSFPIIAIGQLNFTLNIKYFSLNYLLNFIFLHSDQNLPAVYYSCSSASAVSVSLEFPPT